MVKEIIAKIAIGIISALSVASVGVITVASVPALENAIVETFASDEEQFRKVLVENAASDARDFLEVISTKKATDSLTNVKNLINENSSIVNGPFDKSFYFDVNVSDSARMIGNLLQSDIEIPKSLTIDGKVRYDEYAAATDLGLSVNGVEIIRPEFMYDFTQDDMYLGIPVIYDRYIYTNVEIIRSIFSDENILEIIGYALGMELNSASDSYEDDTYGGSAIDLSIFDYLQGNYDRNETFATASAVANLLYVYQQNILNNTWFETEVKNAVGTLYINSEYTLLEKKSVFVEIGENVEEQTCFEITYSSEQMKMLLENAVDLFVSLIEKNANNTNLSEFLRGQWRKNLVEIMNGIDSYDSYTFEYYVNPDLERLGLRFKLDSAEEKDLEISWLGIENASKEVRMFEIVFDEKSLFNLTYDKVLKDKESDYSYVLKAYVGDLLPANLGGPLLGMMIDKDSIANIKISGDLSIKNDYPLENLSGFDLSATLEMLGMKAITLKFGLKDELPQRITLPSKQDSADLLEAIFALYFGLDFSELEKRINEAGYSLGDLGIGL